MNNAKVLSIETVVLSKYHFVLNSVTTEGYESVNQSCYCKVFDSKYHITHRKPTDYA
jgi:hypothetical protein